LPAETRQTYEKRLAEARRAYEHTPNNADSIIWLGRRTAYLGRYREAIAIFGEGVRKHPTDARMYRHRGHRHITVREFEAAIVDLAQADSLERDKPDSVEPDGIPNARGIPTSTLQSNIRYHLGLAHYLLGHFQEAAELYRRDVAAARSAGNADMLVASSHWLYMALRRLGQEREAEAVLAPITAELPVIENGSYHRLLLMYKGQLPPDSLISAGVESVENVTLAYGVGNWHFYNGRKAAAMAIFRRILESPQWGAFGFIAAEADVARLRQQ
jgi:tetratricopeptide (TPR) repeat protein